MDLKKEKRNTCYCFTTSPQKLRLEVWGAFFVFEELSWLFLFLCWCLISSIPCIRFLITCRQLILVSLPQYTKVTYTGISHQCYQTANAVATQTAFYQRFLLSPEESTIQSQQSCKSKDFLYYFLPISHACRYFAKYFRLKILLILGKGRHAETGL